jgi:hypothetical protein
MNVDEVKGIVGEGNVRWVNVERKNVIDVEVLEI